MAMVSPVKFNRGFSQSGHDPKSFLALLRQAVFTLLGPSIQHVITI